MRASRRLTAIIALAGILAIVPASVQASVAPPVDPGTYSTAARSFANCTALNKVYPHGVGKPGARDHVSGSTQPVTNFKVSRPLYRANKGMDRDGDKIACEKR